MTRENWRAKFQAWLATTRAQKIYVTIDLDCLVPEAVFTNWENGRFEIDDLVWALGEVRAHAQVIGGDMCGAWSAPAYETAFQKLAGWWDHPKTEWPDSAAGAGQTNRNIWPSLVCPGRRVKRTLAKNQIVSPSRRKQTFRFSSSF